MKFIDALLDKITMYRMVLYFLIFLVGVAVILCFFGRLSFDPFALLFSAGFFVIVCVGMNTLFAKAFSAPTNIESAYITALILTLIVSPVGTIDDIQLLFWIATLAMASKYILAFHKKHIFNPAAFAVGTISLIGIGYPSWWIGAETMLPFVLLGVFIVRKIRRFDLFLSFFAATCATSVIFLAVNGGNVVTTLTQVLLESSLFFFGFVMLTEPLTTPPTKKLRIICGILIGILFSPQFHIGTFAVAPEVALLLGNLFAYLVSPKEKLILQLQEKITTGSNIIDFVFKPGKKFVYAPGQYMEWTLSHKRADSRGNRRYFTLASSPTEDTLRLGIRFSPDGSSFKKTLQSLTSKTNIVAGSLSGDFTLPQDPTKKLVFIAGGIGITPFRSMIKYLLDTKQKRDVVLFYANKAQNEIVYTDIFNNAQKLLGIKTVYTLTDETTIPKNWKGRVGRITDTMLVEEVPDFAQRTFYLSGPHAMIVAYEDVLKKLKVPTAQIKKDFFPGYA